jgi:chromosomal replication initiator protein
MAALRAYLSDMTWRYFLLNSTQMPETSKAEFWELVLRLLTEDQGVSQAAIDAWLKDCVVMSFDENTVIIYRDDKWKKDVIEKTYGKKIDAVLKQLLDENTEARFICEEDQITASKPKTTSIPNFSSDKYSFSNFIVGRSNEMAYSAARAVVSGNGERHYNPLFIYGNPGLGKTHLLFAVAYEIKKSNSATSIIYVKAESYMNELINSIYSKTMTPFREKYRNCDVLLIDDIQFIAGKDQTQDEFFHTFNSLHESGKQIVLTSDRPPRDILRLEDRLKSRFEWGLMTIIDPPDLETRIAIVNSKAATLGIFIPPEIANYIAENITSNVRMIEGVLNRITVYKELLKPGDELNIEQVIDITSDLISKEKECSPEQIIQCVSDYFVISAGLIMSKNRDKLTARARQLSMYLMRELTDLTLDDIGKLFGRDHSTVIHALKKIEDEKEVNPEIADAIKDVQANIREMNDAKISDLNTEINSDKAN